MVKPGEPSASTEEKILEAAKTVFIRNGLDGTTMQQIADEAGMNKSLLHYYFRSKQKLFATVFKYAFKFIFPKLRDIFASKEHIFIKIEHLVSEYMDLLLKNSMIPVFILHEINRNPDNLVQIMKEAGINPKILMDPIQEEIKKGTIRPIDPRHLIMNIIALCIFPVVARPLAQRLFFENRQSAYNIFLAQRKKEVTDFIISSIKP